MKAITYRFVRDERVERRAGIDRSTLSAFEQAQRFVDLYSMGPMKMGVPVAVPASQFFAQLAQANETLAAWQKKMPDDGWVQGKGAAHDALTKENDDATD